MGVVFLGQDEFGYVAVKTIRPALADDANAMRRFRREVDAAKRVPRYWTAQVYGDDFEHRPGPRADHGTAQPVRRHAGLHGTGALQRPSRDRGRGRVRLGRRGLLRRYRPPRCPRSRRHEASPSIR